MREKPPSSPRRTYEIAFPLLAERRKNANATTFEPQWSASARGRLPRAMRVAAGIERRDRMPVHCGAVAALTV
jgi:hypothetical protein